jgi:hypothetical protein
VHGEQLVERNSSLITDRPVFDILVQVFQAVAAEQNPLLQSRYPGIRFQTEDRYTEGPLVPARSAFFTATTGDDGRWGLLGAAPGRYVISAQKTIGRVIYAASAVVTAPTKESIKLDLRPVTGPASPSPENIIYRNAQVYYMTDRAQDRRHFRS